MGKRFLPSDFYSFGSPFTQKQLCRPTQHGIDAPNVSQLAEGDKRLFKVTFGKIKVIVVHGTGAHAKEGAPFTPFAPLAPCDGKARFIGSLGTRWVTLRIDLSFGIPRHGNRNLVAAGTCRRAGFSSKLLAVCVSPRSHARFPSRPIAIARTAGSVSGSS
jgi:hypothetical protein